MFSSFEECYKNEHSHILSKRRDEENSIAEYIERIKDENPKMVLLDLFYKKQLLWQADLNRRSKRADKFSAEVRHDFDQKLVENNHLSYEVFLGEHI